MNPYSSPKLAARNIAYLIDYLMKEHRDNYVYRGQTEEFPCPLFPSAYRLKLPTGETYDRNSPEYNYSMRRVGKKFIGLQRFKDFNDIVFAYSGNGRIQELHEVELLWEIGTNQQTVEMIASDGFENALRNQMPPDQYRMCKHRLPLWKEVLNRHHRALIRLNGCNEFLGYPIGQALGQHYVESSEYLDVTKSPQIAAFFATHKGPEYVKVVGEENEKIAYPGIIYRFDVGKAQKNFTRNYDYYTAPPFIDALELVNQLEVHSSRFPEWNPISYVMCFLMFDGERLWEKLQMHVGTVTESRIGRQRAGFLIPDELVVERRDSIGRQEVSFQAIEDLAFREGTEKFYFLHRDVDAFKGEVSVESLWPNNATGEQAFLELLRCIVQSKNILMNAMSGQRDVLINLEHSDLWVPPRPDLLTPGPLHAASSATVQ